MQTYTQAYYQLMQARPDGTPDVTIALSTSLDGGAVHELSGTDDAAVRGLVLAAWQYLQALVGGTGAAQTAPITATVELPVAATNPADIFELTVSMTLSRNPALIADAARDQPGVATATLAVSPDLGGGKDETASLRTFAESFETAYATAGTLVKLGVGDSRGGAAGADEARLLWGVRTAIGSGAGIACELTGVPLFWAPPPLSTVPVSRTIPIWPFDPDKGLDSDNPVQTSYSGVDLDVWARQALAAIDGLLSPTYDVPAQIVDTLGGTTYLDDLRTAKSTIASAIAGSVKPVLADETATAAAQMDASEAWKQQMLVTLSSAYTVDVAVQIAATVRGGTDPAYGPPALFGHPTVAAATPPPYTLSPFKISLEQDAAFATFLFTANDPGAQRSIQPTLEYSLDQIEHQIGPVAGISGYEASTWLTFPVPLAGLGSSSPVIPVVVRIYPEPPVLSSQTSEQHLDKTNAQTLVDTATQWTFVAGYSEQHLAQDVTQGTVTFNSAPPPPDLLQAVEEDIVAPLGRLVAVLSEIQASFDADLAQVTTSTPTTAQTFTRAQHALSAFSTLVADAAASWAPLPPVAPPASGVAGAAIPYQFEVVETDSDGDLLVEIVDVDTRPASIPEPSIAIEGYTPVPKGNGTTYKDAKGNYLTWAAAQQLPGRAVDIGPLDVFTIQNARAGVQILRNVNLIDGVTTAPEFVYTTPIVEYTSAFTPLLVVDEPIDVAAIADGKPAARTLAAQLQGMFQGFFSGATQPGTQTIQLQVALSYAIPSDFQQAVLPPIVLPITYLPTGPFELPGDWSSDPPCTEPVTDTSPFVCRLAQVIEQWIAANFPYPSGELTFDLAAYAADSHSTLPIVRLTGLALQRSDIQPG